jgi:hypothetical protein
MRMKVLFAVLVCCALSTPALAQYRPATRHPYYGVELEPHVGWQWSGDEWAWEDGIAIGLRASIPVLEDGPVQSIENNLAVTFGLDWAHFDGDCLYDGQPLDCDEDDIWVPVAAQWNIFVTDRISMFPEVGFGFRNATRSADTCDDPQCDESDFELHFVFWLGARFWVADPVAIVVRIGTPSVLLGASFHL